MRKANQTVFRGILLLMFTSISTLQAQSIYNPQVQIISNVDGFVKYKTINTPSNTAHFHFFGDGFFSTVKKANHQFEDDVDGFYTNTYFNKAYDPSPPTLRGIDTDTTDVGSKTNKKVGFTSSINVGTSWFPVNRMEHYFVLSFENKTASTTSGCVEFFVDSTKVDLTDSSILIYDTWVTNQTISAVNVSGFNKKIKWNYANLLAGEQRHIYIPMTTLASERSSISTGSKYSTSCTSSSGGISTSSFTVMGSPHDPNVKTVNPQCLDPNLPEPQTLNYTIHFQNEGDGFAHNVVIKDMLDPFLDTLTFTLTGSEYTCYATREGRELTLTFPNIQLPGLEQSEPNTYTYDQTESWVTFSICTYPITPKTQCIENSAEIYFDHQPPIATNTAYTCIEEICPDARSCFNPRSKDIIQTKSNSTLNLYPNPATDYLHLEGLDNNENTQIQIHDPSGKLVYDQTQNANEGKLFLNINDLNKGLYFITINGATSYHSQKFYKI